MVKNYNIDQAKIAAFRHEILNVIDPEMKKLDSDGIDFSALGTYRFRDLEAIKRYLEDRIKELD